MLQALIAEYSSKAEDLERPADFDTPRFEQKQTELRWVI
jgi:hypothetical protein